MAPVDRREHRQQRVRGAGPSAVQATFGFNLTALASKKQTSAPPAPLPARRSKSRSKSKTPTLTPRHAATIARRSTPRSGSVRRHVSATPRARSVSVPKSNGVKTPVIVGRKGNGTDEEEDELSPESRNAGLGLLRGVGASAKKAKTISQVLEKDGEDGGMDELSVLEEVAETQSQSQSQAIDETQNQTQTQDWSSVVTPAEATSKSPSTTQKSKSPSTTQKSTSPAATRNPESKWKSPDATQNSKSTDMIPATPAVQPAARAAAAQNSQDPNEESEDELSPLRVNTATSRAVIRESVPATAKDENDMEIDELSPPQVNTATPRTATRKSIPAATPQGDGSLVDELSPEHSAPTQLTPLSKAMQRKRVSDERVAVPQSAKPEKPVVVAQEKPAPVAALPTRPKATKRDRQKNREEPMADPAKRTSKKRKSDEHIEEVIESSPKAVRNKQPKVAQPKPSDKNHKSLFVPEEGDGTDEASDAYEDQPEPEEEDAQETQVTRPPPKPAQITRDKPPRKRQKFLGPKLSISIMRMKGYGVRGVTVADTTRTLLEDTIDGRLTRMMEKLQATQDSARRKELRSDINMALSFKESLNEKLMDLQDANDVLTTNLKKVKLFKRDNAELRKEILGLQNSRQEVALEHDDVQADFEAEKARVEARNALSANMFDIEAAIQNGRRKARKEGRENEGPELPLSMLLGTVGRDVGSLGGGLLARVKGFNSALEKAAGWLEGKA